MGRPYSESKFLCQFLSNPLVLWAIRRCSILMISFDSTNYVNLISLQFEHKRFVGKVMTYTIDFDYLSLSFCVSLSLSLSLFSLSLSSLSLSSLSLLSLSLLSMSFRELFKFKLKQTTTNYSFFNFPENVALVQEIVCAGSFYSIKV